VPPPPAPATVSTTGTNMSTAPGSNLISQSTSAPAVTPAPGFSASVSPSVSGQVFGQPPVIGGTGGFGFNSGRPFFEPE
jgi:carbohydrate-binding DOMON domain-containing protein